MEKHNLMSGISVDAWSCHCACGRTFNGPGPIQPIRVRGLVLYWVGVAILVGAMAGFRNFLYLAAHPRLQNLAANMRIAFHVYGYVSRNYNLIGGLSCVNKGRQPRPLRGLDLRYGALRLQMSVLG